MWPRNASGLFLYEMLTYLDRFGQEIARAERHLRADGTVGASGKADPKRIRMGDTIYVLRRH